MLDKKALQFFKENGRRGGQKRAANLSKEDRKLIAKKAAETRWKKKGKEIK